MRSELHTTTHPYLPRPCGAVVGGAEGRVLDRATGAVLDAVAERRLLHALTAAARALDLGGRIET